MTKQYWLVLAASFWMVLFFGGASCASEPYIVDRASGSIDLKGQEIETAFGQKWRYLLVVRLDARLEGLVFRPVYRILAQREWLGRHIFNLSLHDSSGRLLCCGSGLNAYVHGALDRAINRLGEKAWRVEKNAPLTVPLPLIFLPAAAKNQTSKYQVAIHAVHGLRSDDRRDRSPIDQEPVRPRDGPNPYIDMEKAKFYSGDTYVLTQVQGKCSLPLAPPDHAERIPSEDSFLKMPFGEFAECKTYWGYRARKGNASLFAGFSLEYRKAIPAFAYFVSFFDRQNEIVACGAVYHPDTRVQTPETNTDREMPLPSRGTHFFYPPIRQYPYPLNKIGEIRRFQIAFYELNPPCTGPATSP